MMQIRSVASMMAAVMVAAACSPAPAPAGGEPEPGPPAASAQQGSLAGTAWTLIELRGRSLEPPPQRGAPTLRFDASEDRVGGFAGCNSYFSTYNVEGSRLTFDEIGATRMACTDDQSMPLEQEYLETLRSVTTWQRSGSTLTLSSASGVVARFRLGASETR
ncbi:MAG TPA: META domain-containing protein [Longimicrobium sp.]|nr:META domain-containing protein [Longimicrobium sp.]